MCVCVCGGGGGGGRGGIGLMLVFTINKCGLRKTVAESNIEKGNWVHM